MFKLKVAARDRDVQESLRSDLSDTGTVNHSCSPRDRRSMPRYPRGKMAYPGPALMRMYRVGLFQREIDSVDLFGMIGTPCQERDAQSCYTI